MGKRIAILIRGRQEEGLRMSLGLTLVDDDVDIFILGREFDLEGPGAENFELLEEMEVSVYTDNRDLAPLEYLSTAEIARRLPGYDHILPY